ncbi:MAG: biotin/lipoyl-binding protein, partial [Phycisphaerae bacterium]|nr:biotin/lipoyl-binding protein [Phycisphaerae bacterium]
MPRLSFHAILPFVAALGIAGAVIAVYANGQAPSGQGPFDQPARSEFARAIAGAALVEPASEFVSIGTEIAGVATEVPVVAGDRVARGDLLFRLDTRAAEAELAARTAEWTSAQATRDRLRGLPRAEDVPAAQARVAAAEASWREATSLLALVERVDARDAIAPGEIERRRYLVESRAADVDAAKAALALLEAGAWQRDLDVAEAAVTAAERRVDAARVEVERRSIRAPLDATVLRVDVRPGEYVAAGGGPALVLGAVDELRVRVDIDENDAWRVRPEAPATASLKGNSAATMKLRFVRIEPYVVPKRS